MVRRTPQHNVLPNYPEYFSRVGQPVLELQTNEGLNNVMNVKVLVDAFNQESTVNLKSSRPFFLKL